MTTAAATKETKTIRAEVKQAGDDGSFEAVIATLGVVDHDGDIIEPGALDGKTALIVPAHDWGSVPLGKVRVEERGDEAVANGRFYTDAATAREWFSVIKADVDSPPSVMEWSWGFFPTKVRFEERDGDQVRIIEDVDLVEVSPVLRGAGVGTGTLMAKQRFANQIDEAMLRVVDIASQVTNIRKLREEEGRTMSKDRTAQLKALLEKMTDLVAATEALADSVREDQPGGEKGASFSAGQLEELAKAEDAAEKALAAWTAHQAGIRADT